MREPRHRPPDEPIDDPSRALPPAIELPDEAERVNRVWSDGSGVLCWLSAVNHKTIGRRYIVTAFGFFLGAGILAGLMRLQLSRPNNPYFGPDAYDQIFTMHGTTMMFLFAVPIMEALGVYLVPLMVGARNI